MKKLNCKGLGLSTFLVFIGIFLFSILMVAYLTNYYGIGVEQTERPQTNNNIERYQKYELEVKNAAISYIDANYDGILTEDLLIISIERLELDLEITKNCSGYVKAENEDGVYVRSYLKCGSYKTAGYSALLDQ